MITSKRQEIEKLQAINSELNLRVQKADQTNTMQTIQISKLKSTASDHEKIRADLKHQFDSELDKSHATLKNTASMLSQLETENFRLKSKSDNIE